MASKKTPPASPEMPKKSSPAKSSPKKTTVNKAPAAKIEPANAASKKTVTKKTITEKKIAAAEHSVDTFVKQVSKKAEKSISPSIRDKAKKIAHSAELMASKVESVGQELEQITESILPEGKGTTTHFSVEWQENVSRLFVFRCLWMLIQGPIIAIRSIWYLLISIVHYISMFLFAKRNKELRESQTRYRRQVISRKAYINGLSDKRPELIVD